MTRVVVTRATEDAQRLGRRLSDAGHIAIQLPLMAIESTRISWDTDSTPAVTTIYIFTSVNAVRHGLSGMTQGSESSLVQVIAVGLRTRIALADAGIQASSPVRVCSIRCTKLASEQRCPIKTKRSQSPKLMTNFCSKSSSSTLLDTSANQLLSRSLKGTPKYCNIKTKQN